MQHESSQLKNSPQPVGLIVPHCKPSVKCSTYPGGCFLHPTTAGIGLQWQLFFPVLKVAALSSAQIVVINVTLIVITAMVARFGVEALSGRLSP